MDKAKNLFIIKSGILEKFKKKFSLKILQNWIEWEYPFLKNVSTILFSGFILC